MRHLFSIGQDTCEVWLSRSAGRYRLDLDGETSEVALEPLSPSQHRLILDGEVTELDLVVDGGVIHVHLDGRSYEVGYHDPVAHFAAEASGSGEDVARAPMPGLVIAMPVVAGDPVAVGDTLVVIESMKLETAIKAWRAGIVSAVHVSIGQSFERDAPLISLAGLGD